MQCIAVNWVNCRVLPSGIAYAAKNVRRLIHHTTLRETAPIEQVKEYRYRFCF